MPNLKGSKWQKLIKSAEYYGQQSRKTLSPIISKLAAVANKRLKRMQEYGIEYGEYEGKDSISGVKKFGAKGKTLGELRAEYKRLQGFLESGKSSLTQRKERYYEAKVRAWQHNATPEQRAKGIGKPKKRESYKEYISKSRPEEADFFDALSKVFETARNEGWLSKSGELQRMQDSNQLQELYEEKIMSAKGKGKETIDEIIKQVRKNLGVESPFEDEKIEKDDFSTSSLI